MAGVEAALYLRDVDVRENSAGDRPQDHYFARAHGIRLTRVPRRFAGGRPDCNIAEGHLECHAHVSAFATCRDRRSAAILSLLSLWTLWGVQPRAVQCGEPIRAVSMTDWLSLSGRGERYHYERADVSTALAPAGGSRMANELAQPRRRKQPMAISGQMDPGRARRADGALTRFHRQLVVWCHGVIVGAALLRRDESVDSGRADGSSPRSSAYGAMSRAS